MLAEKQTKEAEKQSKVALAYLAISASYRAGRKVPFLGGLLALQGLSLARSVNDRTARMKAADQVRRAMNSRLLWSSPPYFPGGDVNAIAFTPDGQHLAAASGKLIRLWDVETGGEDPPKTPIEHDADVKAIAFTPDGTLVAGDGSGAVRLWEIQTGDENRPSRSHEASGHIRSRTRAGRIFWGNRKRNRKRAPGVYRALERRDRRTRKSPCTT